MSDWGNVAVVFRTGGAPHPKFVEAWTWLIWLGLRPGDMVMAPAVRFPAHRAANRIVASFLGESPLAKCDTLCFVDDDHVFGFETLERLRSDERLYEYDIVGALYAARGRPDKGAFPVALELVPEHDDDGHPLYLPITRIEHGQIVPCHAIGLGFTLIRRSILEAVGPPWFAYREPSTTEDVVFCERAREHGAKIAVHGGIVIGHLQDLVVLPKLYGGEESGDE